MEFSVLDIICIKFYIGWIGITLCLILSALYKRIRVKRKKDELELKQWVLSLKK